MSLYEVDSLSNVPSLSTAVLSEVISLSKLIRINCNSFTFIFQYHFAMAKHRFVLLVEVDRNYFHICTPAVQFVVATLRSFVTLPSAQTFQMVHDYAYDILIKTSFKFVTQILSFNAASPSSHRVLSMLFKSTTCL